MSTVDPALKVAPAEAADWPLVLDGELMRAGEAMIPAGDDGLIRGDGAFDAFPVVDGRPFARAAHLDRLERSCRALVLDCPREQIESDIDLLLRRAPDGYTVVRVVLTRGGLWICRLESPGDRGAPLARPVRPAAGHLRPIGAAGRCQVAFLLLPTCWPRAGRWRPAMTRRCSWRSDGVVLEGPTCSMFWVRDGRLQNADARYRHPRLDHAPGDPRADGGRGGQFPAGARRRRRGGIPGVDRAAGPANAGDRRGDPPGSAPGPQTLRAQQVIELAMAEHAIA